MNNKSNIIKICNKEISYENRELFAIGCNVVIFNPENEVLLLFRSKNNNYNPNSWDLPGGQLEEGESPEDSIKRETFEETGIEINLKSVFDIDILNKSTCLHKIISIKYIATCSDTSVILSNEHINYYWSPIERLPFNLDLKLKNVINKASSHYLFVKKI